MTAQDAIATESIRTARAPRWFYGKRREEEERAARAAAQLIRARLLAGSDDE